MSDSQTLPQGWSWTPIGTIAEFNPRHDLTALPDTSPVSFVPMASVEAGTGRMDPSEQRPLGLVRHGYTSFREEDILFAKITPCMENGKSAVARGLTSGIGFGSTEFHVLRSMPAVDADYLYYYVSQERFRQAARAKMTGTAGQLRVPSSFMREATFPLAPLAEQRRIVAAIEEQFTRLDAGMAALKSARARLKQYRAAVLKAAVEGELTKEWREAHPETEPASELMGRILQERRSQWEEEQRAKGKDPIKGRYSDPPHSSSATRSSIRPEWALVRLEQVAGLITSGSRGWAEYYAKHGATFIRAQDINTDELNLDSIAHVCLPKTTEGTRTRVRCHDLLITITGANVTKTALVRQHLPEAYVSQHVGLVRPVLSSLAPFLYLWIVTPSYGRKALERAAYGAGKPGLNLENLRDLLVVLPPLAEQKQIVAEVERRLSVLNILETSITEGLQRAERLRQSILTEAFAGRLVPQDPDDEPADRLLARVQAGPKEVGSTRQRKKFSAKPSQLTFVING